MPKVIGKYHLCNTPNFRDNFGSLQGLDGKDILITASLSKVLRRSKSFACDRTSTSAAPGTY